MDRFSDNFIRYASLPKGIDKTKVKPLLWPVYVWDVYAPDYSNKTSNLFEKTLLSFLSMRRAKRLEKEHLAEMASWLGIEPDMVTYIVENQLKPKKWLDEDGWLTKEGHDAMNQQVTVSSSLTSGLVFQDAVYGQLLPRVAKRWQPVDPVSDDPLSFSQSKGSNWSWKPWILPKSKNSSRPSSNDLEEALSATRLALRNAELMDFDIEEDQQNVIDSIDLARETPQRAYLWIWVHADEQEVWSVGDPFSYSDKASWMRERVDKAAASNEALSKSLMKIIGVTDETSSLNHVMDVHNEQARLEVLSEYGYAEKVDGLLVLLQGWMHRRLEVETAEASNHYHNYSDLITQSSGLIEHCLRYCLEKYPLLNLRVIPKACQRADLRKIIENAVPNLSGQQLDRTVTVSPGQVYSAAKNKKGSFRRCLAACLIAMPDHRDHPMKLVVGNESLFLDAYELSRWRDKTAHADSDFRLTKDIALKACSIAERFLREFCKGF